MDIGDAILVTFSAEIPNENKGAIISRAFKCCVDILNDHPDFNFDERDFSLGQTYSSKSGTTQSYRLQLHIAITSGEGSHVIAGDMERLDYFVNGNFLKGLGSMLDNSSKGNKKEAQRWKEC